MIKVLMTPHLSEIGKSVSGIHTVIRKYFQHLPQFDIELVAPDATSYDVKAAHAGITGGDCIVCHAHGLYWSADVPCDEWEWHVNSRVIEAIRNAKEITVPSDWVNETFKRDLRKPAHVIPHGVDLQEWQHKEPSQGYVLWAKNRNGSDVVSNHVLDVLIPRFENTLFVSTFTTPNLARMPHQMWPKNFKIIETGGKTPHEEMRGFVQRAGIYLSTAKETFGIGTLEAMASGVPVLGWDWGGNTQLIQHGVNGYLAKVGDIDDLCEGLAYCLKHRKTLGQNGQELAKQWTWEKACEMVAGVYRLAMEDKPAVVSVVIPVYNKPVEQVKRAVESCLDQTLKPEKIIIINDGSTEYNDDIEAYSRKLLESSQFIYLRYNNSGVAIARNNGIALTYSTYICCLDADDWIEPTFLETCVNELEQDRSLGIAYTGLMTHNPDGTNVQSAWPGKFNPDAQLTYAFKQNQVPTCCVFRRDAWERVGGYKARYAPMGCGSEDAALWSVITSIGYSAKQVTSEPLFNYSIGQGGASGNPNYQEVDWLSMYPWAKDGQHPFASVATPKKYSHPVRQYDDPAISVIIPVGPGHELEVQNALDSLEMQHFRKWEVIVIDDTELSNSIHESWHYLAKAYPYVRWVNTAGRAGAGHSRNRGVEAARAPLILFLDADDVLGDANALDKMILAWNQNEGIIYSDYLGKAQWDYEAAQKEFGDKLLSYNPKKGTAVFKAQAADFDSALAQRQPELNQANPNMPYYHWCLVSCLIPKAWHNAIGGFDETMETWEDVDYFWRLARAGYCFYRVPEPLIMYAYHKGHRRQKSAVNDESSLQAHKAMIQYIKRKYEGLEIVACNCGAKRKQAQVTAMSQVDMANDSQFVMIEFDYQGSGSRDTYGQKLVSPTRQPDPTNPNKVLEYKGYSRRKGDRFLVHIKDQQARPDLFRLIPNEIKVPDLPKVELPEPVLIVAEAKRRGRPAKVAI